MHVDKSSAGWPAKQEINFYGLISRVNFFFFCRFTAADNLKFVHTSCKTGLQVQWFNHKFIRYNKLRYDISY